MNVEFLKSPQALQCVNTIRTLSIDAIQKANSGHPGLPMGAAPMAFVLWTQFLKHHPKNPQWTNRDRFVLSPGHGSMLLYSLLHLTGYDVSLEEIQNFRQWNSLTPGHPEAGLTPGVECTTGPLGQGTANSVGFAVAERALAQLFNRPAHSIVDHWTYAIVSDGDLMEGIAAEAASLAGHLKLGKLIWLYDSNDITLDGPTSLTFSTEDVAKRHESYGWQVLTVRDGDKDLVGISQAIEKARQETTKPSLIIVKTTIGYGSPNKKGTSGVHGSPLGEEEVKLTKKELGFPPDRSFYLPEEALQIFKKVISEGEKNESQWNAAFESYQKQHPELAKDYQRAFSGELPPHWDSEIKFWDQEEDFQKKLATRKASGQILNALSQTIPWLIGGDADLSCSTNTALKNMGSFEGQEGKGRNIHFGVREHAMAGLLNGIAYHGGLRSFAATFFVFSDYMKPSLRLAAMNHLPNIYVWTHDSIGLGEDGPTHQPIEHLAALRAVPNFATIRPCDANETAQAWKSAIQNQKGPTGIILSRQDLPILRETSKNHSVSRGGYILKEGSNDPQVILIASGSEVHLALQVQDQLESQHKIPARVVSLPSWELFEDQEPQYQNKVLCQNKDSQVLRVSIEAGVSLGWERWIGQKGLSISLERFGASAPGPVLFENLGFSPSQIVQKILQRLSRV